VQYCDTEKEISYNIKIAGKFLKELAVCKHGERDYSNPITAQDRACGFQEVESPRFQDNRHMKVVRLSALHNGHLCPPENIPGTHFC
jgi:hypothetical protein